MNNKVNQVIAENVKFSEMIIQSKSIVSQGSLGLEHTESIKIIQIPDLDVFLNGVLIIKYERGLKGIAVNHCSRYADQRYNQSVTPPSGGVLMESVIHYL